MQIAHKLSSSETKAKRIQAKNTSMMNFWETATWLPSRVTSGANIADVENGISRADSEVSRLAPCIEICGQRAKRLRTELEPPKKMFK